MKTFLTKNGTGMESFYTKNGTWGWNRSWLRTEQGWNHSSNKERQERNRTGRPFFYSERNRTQQDETRTERERNDLAEGPRSRTERNDFKKVGTCPALPRCSRVSPQRFSSLRSSLSCRISQLLLIIMFVQQLLLSLPPRELKPMFLFVRIQLLLSILSLEDSTWFYRRMTSILLCS